MDDQTWNDSVHTDQQLTEQQNAVAPPDSYHVQEDDDLKEVFNSGFESVTSSEWATPGARILAHQNGYFLRSKQGTAGWEAKRR